MVISINSDLETAIDTAAKRKGVSPEELALTVLRERFLHARPFVPRNDWDRALLAAASDCGVSLSNEAVSSEGLYD